MNATPFLIAPGARSALPILAPLDCFAAPSSRAFSSNDERAQDYLFGPAWLPDGRVRFRLWAPDAAEQGHAVRLEIAGLGPVYMAAGPNGWFEAIVPCCEGARYWFRLDDGTTVPDPASRWQADDVHGPSIVPARDAGASYAWACPDWRGRPWHEAIVFEIHVGLCGGFAGAAQQLPRLAALGFTAVELMPVAEFPGGRNWGYDGVLPFAPESGYGTPDELRALVDRAHTLGLMVLLDVVYNHFGPEGNYLHRYASPFFRSDRETSWGPAIDFRRPQVRRFFTENARYWLEQFRFDGLRLDAVHAIEDEGWLAALPGELRTTLASGNGGGRHLHLVLENDDNDAALLAQGFDAQWNDDAHHALHVLLTGEDDGYYRDYASSASPASPAGAAAAPAAGERGRPALRHLARVLAEGFAYQGEPSLHRSAGTTAAVCRGQPSAHLPPTAFVSFLQNHDQTGNRAFGERLTSLADPRALRAAVALQLLCPQVPLVFMGEETGARQPFLYFTSHPPELAQAVRDGRRREFAASAAFGDDARAAAIPDPNDPATFEASRPSLADDTDWAPYYRELLSVRRRELLHRLPGCQAAGVDILGPAALCARWRLVDGMELSLWLNLGDEAVPATQPCREQRTALHESAPGAAAELSAGMLPPLACVATLCEPRRGAPQVMPATAATAPAAARGLPRATARLQLHPGFTFADAACVVDYYAALGVSHLYLSPVCEARPGSTHGYDVTDFTRVREELGGEAGLKALAARARSAGLGLIVDIVPNHMAADCTHNGWWRDVLAHGRASPHAGCFDIDWTPRDPALHGKVLLPILGQSYWDTLVAGELQWVPASAEDAAHLRYFDHVLPLAPDSPDAEVTADPGCYDTTQPAGRTRLHALLERQHYRLAWWRTAAASLNWRRFFEISDLVGVREEDPQVFDAVHALVFRLLREGWIDGVRVDHVDGLADPAGYCRRLRAGLDRHAAARPPLLPLQRPWLVVEKILGSGERLPPDWQVDGTTGYDFMDDVAAVLHDEAGEAALTALWAMTSGDARPYAAHVRAARCLVLQRHLVTECEGVTARLHACAQQEPGTRDLTPAALRHALIALMAAVPVYRSYYDAQPSARDAAAAHADDVMVDQALQSARSGLAPDEAVALAFIAGCLRTQAAPDSDTGVLRRRLQQLMPALAAKAGEDTAFYRYGRLLSRNEVGSDPAQLAMPPAQFHARMAARRLAGPHAMLATATHDHKRGEDARIRLAVLSELPGTWADAVAAWERDGASLLATLPRAPDAADRLMLYQALVGAWPMDPMDHSGHAAPVPEALLGRISAWQVKAIREAKRHGNWTCPDAEYEAACEAFLRAIAAAWPQGVLAQIGRFAQRIAIAGAVNSLAQVLVQLTAPGIPDRYQGTEGWDLSLVDPDNRCAPDFGRLQARLACRAGWAHWLAHWRDGRLKQQLVRHALAARRDDPALFADGQYSMLAVQGTLAQQALAFARSTASRQAVTVVTRLSAARVDPAVPRIPPACWGDTTLNLGAPQPGRWIDALTGHRLDAPTGRLRLRDVLGGLPVALLLREP